MDLKLDTNTGDCVYTNGVMEVVSDASNNVAQRLYIMLRTFAGEWYLNTEHGVPYLQSILGQKTKKSAVDLIFQQKILAEQGVQEVVEFTSSLSDDRVYTASFKVKSNNLTVVVPPIVVGV